MLQRQPLLCHTLRLGRLSILKQQAQPLKPGSQCIRRYSDAGLCIPEGLDHVALLACLQGLLEGPQSSALTYGCAQHLPIGVRLQLLDLVQPCCPGFGLVEAPVLDEQVDQQALIVQTPGGRSYGLPCQRQGRGEVAPLGGGIGLAGLGVTRRHGLCCRALARARRGVRCRGGCLCRLWCCRC